MASATASVLRPVATTASGGKCGLRDVDAHATPAPVMNQTSCWSARGDQKALLI